MIDRAQRTEKAPPHGRKAEEALAASRVRLSDAMELAKIVYWEVDPTTMEFIFNDAFYTLYGTTVAREGGYRMSRGEYGKRFVHPDDMPTFRQSAEKRQKTREPDLVYDLEHRIIRRDGEVRHILVRIHVTKDGAGRLTSYYGANQDVTEHRRMAQAVRESEERLRLTLEATNDGVLDWNIPTGRAVFSPRFYTMLGYEPYEFPENNESWRSLVHPDDIDRVEDQIDEHISRDEGYAVEFRMRNKSGDWIWILARGKGVEHDGQGHPVRMVCTHTDITDRKRAEDALRESEARFRAAFETSATGMTLITLNHHWFKVNRSFCAMVGYSEEELLAKTPRDITHPEDLDSDLGQREGLMKGRIPYYRIEKRYFHRDGHIVWILLCVSVVRDSQGHPLYFVSQIEDITERKLLEEKLQAMSITDELTGLYNRRGFFELCQEQLKLAMRRKEELLLFFVDLDHMKRINDTLGHQKGDQALVDAARVLRNTFRKSDIIGRVGGDEFAVLAIETLEDQEKTMIGRLQDNLDSFNRADGRRDFPISVSVGSSRCEPGKPRALEALMVEADKCMYRLKREKKGLSFFPAPQRRKAKKKNVNAAPK